MKKTYKGIDISSYNENINYDVIAKQVDFAILRAGFTGWGTHSLNVDKKFNQHYDGLRRYPSAFIGTPALIPKNAH